MSVSDAVKQLLDIPKQRNLTYENGGELIRNWMNLIESFSYKLETAPNDNDRVHALKVCNSCHYLVVNSTN